MILNPKMILNSHPTKQALWQVHLLLLRPHRKTLTSRLLVVKEEQKEKEQKDLKEELKEESKEELIVDEKDLHENKLFNSINIIF